MSGRKPKPIRWLNAAVEDATGIVEWIARDNPQAAERFSEQLLERVELLRDFPHLGGVCPYYQKARQLIRGRYIVYYTVHRQEVVIRAIVDGARLFRSYWLRRED